MSRARFLFAATAALAGCASDVPALTEMVVVVEAGPGVRAMADRVEVGFSRGHDPAVTTVAPVSASSEVFTRPSWPLSLTLVAAKPSDTLSLVITAYQGSEPLVTRSVLTQFVAERSLLLGLELEDACIGDLLSCASYGQTCDVVAGQATCVAPALDARALPDYEGQRYDAGPLTPLDAGADAEASGDAAVKGDAGL
jgi:hypothetical protein